MTTETQSPTYTADQFQVVQTSKGYDILLDGKKVGQRKTDRAYDYAVIFQESRVVYASRNVIKRDENNRPVWKLTWTGAFSGTLQGAQKAHAEKAPHRRTCFIIKITKP